MGNRSLTRLFVLKALYLLKTAKLQVCIHLQAKLSSMIGVVFIDAIVQNHGEVGSGLLREAHRSQRLHFGLPSLPHGTACSGPWMPSFIFCLDRDFNRLRSGFCFPTRADGSGLNLPAADGASGDRGPIAASRDSRPAGRNRCPQRARRLLDSTAIRMHDTNELVATMRDPGLDVQHVEMARKHSRDPHAASDVLKAVLDKHHHQRETREYHPAAHKEPEGSRANLRFGT